MSDFQGIQRIVGVAKGHIGNVIPQPSSLGLPLITTYSQIIFVIKRRSQNKLITRESDLHFTAVFTTDIIFSIKYELAKVIRKKMICEALY